MTRSRRKPRGFRRLLRWGFRLLLLFLVVDLIYVASIWPDWQWLARGPIPKSRFMDHYLAVRAANHWPRMRWHPVPLSQIPRSLQRAVIVAEDSSFYENDGFDLSAIKDAFDYNLEKGRVVFGASTISQQTVKNLFLTPSRTPIRKWHEALLTWGLDHHLTKRRILELYLNTAEFGRGIYGVDAASEAYWGVPVSQLSVVQAAELAASLPSPVRNNPAHRGVFFVHHAEKILNLLARQFEVPPESQDTGLNAENPSTTAPPAGTGTPPPAPAEDQPTEPLHTI